MSYDWTGKVLLWDEWGVFVGSGGRTPIHHHLASKFVIGLDRPIRVIGADGVFREGRILPVLAGEKHQVIAEGARVGLCYFDSGIFNSSFTPSVAELRRLVSLCRNIDRGDKEVAQDLNIESKVVHPIILDSRVNQAVDRLRQREMVRLDVVASQVGLSSSRLRHLFTSQVGGAPVTYRRWRRLWFAAELLGRGEKIVDAALESGFSDSSHLTRTFVEMLGISPRVFQGSKTIVLSTGSKTAKSDNKSVPKVHFFCSDQLL